ncbi:MAG: hypothetical protein HFJ38_05355 [Bacilli bacterium]|nr:hypothetical protein [Bacilli bacterium]
MDTISLEEFKNKHAEEYQTFLKENPEIGRLKIEVFTAYKAIPLENTEIIITKNIGNKTIIFFRGFTNSSGIIENITLPAPSFVSSETPFVEPKYTIYDLVAIHKEYKTVKEEKIGMFGNVNIIQYIKMTPEVKLEGVDTLGN